MLCMPKRMCAAGRCRKPRAFSMLGIVLDGLGLCKTDADLCKGLTNSQRS